MSNPSRTENHQEQTIVALLQANDKRGITLLYENYSGALYHIILRVTQSEEIAQEVLQDVFVKIWTRFAQYDKEKGRLFTWMSQIARNSAIDATRSGKFKRRQKTETLPDTVSNDGRLSETLSLQDSGLREVVTQLDQKYREIIDYVYFRDYTHKEASEALDIPLGTVKSRVRLAVIALRKSLGNERTTLLLGPALVLLQTLIELIY